MKYLLEITKIVEASIESNRRKLLGYLDQLTRKLKKDGESEAYVALSRMANLALTNFSATAGSLVTASDSLPQDKESRLDLLERSNCNESNTMVFLSRGIIDKLNDFLELARGAGRFLGKGIDVTPSLLLYGPPGVGKSETAKYISAKLGVPLYTVRTDSLVSSYLGSTSKNLRMVFDFVKAEPCVLFLDELDAIAKQRDDGHELGELKRVVISLLQNIDSLGAQTILVAATNHEHLLDPAIWRRFYMKLQLSLPGKEERMAMFKAFLRGYQIGSAPLRRLVCVSQGMSGAEIRDACTSAVRQALLASDRNINPLDVIRKCVEVVLPNDFVYDLKDVKSWESFYKRFGDGTVRQKEMAELFNVSPATISRKINGTEVNHG